MVQQMDPNKCVQCMFSLKGNAVTDPDLKATISDNELSTVDTVTYLGPIMLRESLESVCVYPFLQINFDGFNHLLSLFANLPGRS